MKTWIKLGEAFLEVEIAPADRGYRCRLKGERTCEVMLHPLDAPGVFVALIDGRPQMVWLETRGEEVRVHNGQAAYTLYLSRIPPELRGARGPRAVGPVYVRAPMTGLLAEVLKSPGDPVEEGEPLAVVEAMKMRNQIRAPSAGVLRELRATSGTQVDHGQVIAVIEPR